jgi:hypothetical protein
MDLTSDESFGFGLECLLDGIALLVTQPGS